MAYKIKKGDTLSKIAKDKGTTVAALMKANPSIKDKNSIRAGSNLTVPAKKKTTVNAASFDQQSNRVMKAPSKKDVKKKVTQVDTSKASSQRKGMGGPSKSASQYRPGTVPKTSSKRTLVDAANFDKQPNRVMKPSGTKGVSTPTSRPKLSTPTSRSSTSTPKKKTDLPADFTKSKTYNAPNVGLGKMKKFGGLPVGAKLYKGKYDSKTHKLQNINGKTYVVPKPKAKRK